MKKMTRVIALIVITSGIATVAVAAGGVDASLDKPGAPGETASSIANAGTVNVAAPETTSKARPLTFEALPVDCFVPLVPPTAADDNEKAKAKDALLLQQRNCFLAAAKIEAEVRRRTAFAPWPTFLRVALAAIPWVLLLLMLVASLLVSDVKGVLRDDNGKFSLSRIVALAGGAILLSYLMSFGTLLIWGVGATGFVPPMSDLGTLLMYSIPLFVPYVANQIKSGIVALKQ